MDDPHSTNSGRLGQRMGRVEELLEKLMERVLSSEAGLHSDGLSHRSHESPAALAVDVIPPSSTPVATQYESAPVLSLFDNAVVSDQSHLKW